MFNKLIYQCEMSSWNVLINMDPNKKKVGSNDDKMLISSLGRQLSIASYMVTHGEQNFDILMILRKSLHIAKNKKLHVERTLYLPILQGHSINLNMSRKRKIRISTRDQSWGSRKMVILLPICLHLVT